ncbi:DNA translocase FtsK, partial [Patescibacteria group bacterium]|nr:DNA translocase FtsK [Patescibacteria group bacterium]
MAKKRKRRKSSGKRIKDKRSFKVKLKPNTVFSIIQIVFFSLAGLIIISFSRQGSILFRVNDFLVGYLSWTTVLLPFIFLSIGFLVSKFKTPLGQPNVIVGGLLFFISVTFLTRAGMLGKIAWGSIVTLITGAGAFIVLLGSAIVGLIILFNTSLDQVIGVFVRMFRQYGIQERGKKAFRTKGKKEMKVLGGSPSVTPLLRLGQKTKEPTNIIDADKKEPLEQKLVSNVPGEDKVWKYPPADILSDTQAGKVDRGDIKGNATMIEKTLESFGITARVVEVNLGPAVTQYAIEVALGTKLSKITALERDLALALAAPTGTIRIEAPIPGRSLVGIELPNRAPEFVPLKKIMESEEMQNNSSKLAVALGLDVSGKTVVADLSRMPHVLIAGQTGSGKSVCVNTFLSTMLLRASPSEVKLILVDP